MKFWLAWIVVMAFFRALLTRVLRYSREEPDPPTEPWQAPPTAWGAPADGRAGRVPGDKL